MRRLSTPAKQRMRRRLALLVLLGAALVIGVGAVPVTMAGPLG